MRLAAIILAFALPGCVASNVPPHPLAGNWHGDKVLSLGVSEYWIGDERGHWSADKRALRFVRDDGAKVEDRCQFTLTGRTMVLSHCRLAGRYVRIS